MILLRILSDSEQQMKDITTILLKERLVIDVNFKRNIERVEYNDGSLTITKLFLITAKTKSSMFTTIDKRLREECKDRVPEIYSLPIVHMDWEQANQLSEVFGKN